MKSLQAAHMPSPVDPEIDSANIEPQFAATDGAPVQAIDDDYHADADTGHTETWANGVNERERTPTPAVRPTGRSPAGRRLCATLASPIPAMLAESMALAQEDTNTKPAAQANLVGTGGRGGVPAKIGTSGRR